MKLELKHVAKWKGDVVVVEVLEAPEKVGSLFMPDNHRDVKDEGGKLWKGRVKAFGDDLNTAIAGWEDVKLGDTVWMRPFALNCPKFKDSDGSSYVVARQEDVFVRELVS